MIDYDEIRKELAISHNVIIAKDDPILIAVTLNELVFQKYIDILMEQNLEYTEAVQKALDKALQKSVAEAKLTGSRVINEAADYVSEQTHMALTVALEASLIKIRKELSEAKKEVQTARHTAATVIVSCAVMIIFFLLKIAV